MTFACDAAPQNIRFDGFFSLIAAHTNFAKIREDSGQHESVFTFGHREIALSGNGTGAAATEQSDFFTYVGLGIRHLASGLDHLAFLLALLLLVTSPRQIIFVVTGFTIGHSITLSLAVLGIATPNVPLVEATIGFTIALVAIENIAVQTRLTREIAIGFAAVFVAFVLVAVFVPTGPPWVAMVGLGLFGASYLGLSSDGHRAMQLRPILTVLFGMVHGFGFSAVLTELDLPTAKLVPALLGFNIGVEVGQLMAIGVFGLGLYVVKSRSKGAAYGIVTDILSTGLLAIGFYWFVARGFGL
jgi:hypothetical protein